MASNTVKWETCKSLCYKWKNNTKGIEWPSGITAVALKVEEWIDNEDNAKADSSLAEENIEVREEACEL